MNTPKFSIILVTIGVVIYMILCNSHLPIPAALLIVFLFVLHIGLIWMAICILKNGKPSGHTFDQRLYDDVDLNSKR